MCTYKKSRVDVDLHNHRNWILHQFKDNKKPYNLYSKNILASSTYGNLYTIHYLDNSIIKPKFKSIRFEKNIGTIVKNTTSVLTIYVFCLYIVMYAIDVSVTFISIFSDRGTFDISFFANVFHVLHTRCGCRIIVLPRESFLILERLKEWQTINKNDPYVFPCFAVSVD